MTQVKGKVELRETEKTRGRREGTGLGTESVEC